MIQIIPAIDIIGGRCVRLCQGDYGKVKTYDASPVDMARAFEDCGVGRLHLVDLDGAKASDTVNIRTLEAIASSTSMELEWGGGISSDRALQDIFNAGATSGIIGSLAIRQSEVFKRWLNGFGPKKIILGADVRGRSVAIHGWTQDSGMDISELIDSFLPDGLEEVICTDISRDGMLQGPNTGLYTDLKEKYPQLIFTVSGGISSMSDIEALEAAGLQRVIAGKAIYENRITLKEIEKWSLRG